MTVLAFERDIVGRAFLPLRQETDAALRAGEILDDPVFCEHDPLHDAKAGARFCGLLLTCWLPVRTLLIA